MKKRGILFFTLAILTIFLLGSCDNPALYGNLFGEAGLGKPSQEKLDEQAQSDDPAVAQPALALTVENNLEASGAAPVVEGLVDLIIEGNAALEDLATDGSSMDTVLETLIPPEVLSQPNGIADLIDSIIATLPDLDAFAASVSADGFAAEGSDVQTLAMTAVFATVFNELDPVTPGASVGDAIQAFYDDYQLNPAVTIDAYVTIAPGTDFGTLLSADGSTTAVLLNLVGLDIAALMGA